MSKRSGVITRPERYRIEMAKAVKADRLKRAAARKNLRAHGVSITSG